MFSHNLGIQLAAATGFPFRGRPFAKLGIGTHFLLTKIQGDFRNVPLADSDEGGHLFQSDRGHPSDLMAAT